MNTFLKSTGGGLAAFYFLCAVTAAGFFIFQQDGLRISANVLEQADTQGYWASLKFNGLLFIALFVVIELVALKFMRHERAYDWGDSGASLAIYLINVFATPFTMLYLYALLKFAEVYALFQIGDGLVPFLITILLVEGAYYWYHRLSHEIPFLWSIHHTHHSAQSLNLSIAFRLHTFGRLVSPFVYLPMILLGFKPEYILAGLAFSLVYQFFLHTETIPKLGWLENTGFNTPSKHRVHHGTNDYCIDKNYGGMLVVWDHIFGTYVPESERVDYGVSTGFYSYNPLKVMFRPQLDWLRGDFHREREIKARADDMDRKAAARQTGDSHVPAQCYNPPL